MTIQTKDSPFTQNIVSLLHQAIGLNASDLHIEPFSNCIRIRARVDGNLQVIQSIENHSYFERFLSQAKKLCQFDMAKHFVPQDSRFELPGYINEKNNSVTFDARASLIPTQFGEKIVLRFLERNKKFSLDSYPMPDLARLDLKETLEKWQGLILVTGPTGSGKTTLLYSALSYIDGVSNNIHTIEDPIEYVLNGVVQSQIKRGSLSFSKAISTLMRQDPDCILIGEIRDQRTAHAAMHAASTGHLVFSTIHANSSLESITRLSSLGVKKNLIAENLLLASAQRLIPKNCPHCLEDDLDSSEKVFKAFHISILPKKSVGCKECKFTGVLGRYLLYEYLKKDPQTKKLELQSTLKEGALDALKKGEINAQNACSFS